MLQEDIKLTSPGTTNQANLTDHVGHNIDGKNCPWKEVNQTRTVSLPLSTNRFDPLSSHPEDDDIPVSTVASRIA
jgi:hypothetical protein